jgi:hypothetical protein
VVPGLLTCRIAIECRKWIYFTMSNEKKRSVRCVSAKTIYALLFLYIPRFPARCPRVCRRNIWVRILLLSPSYSFPFFFFPFPFPFFILLSFSFTFQFTVPTTIDGVYLSFCRNIFIWDLVSKDLLKGIRWCNQNLIWFLNFLSYYNIFVASSNNGAHHLMSCS